MREQVVAEMLAEITLRTFERHIEYSERSKKASLQSGKLAFLEVFSMRCSISLPSPNIGTPFTTRV